MKPRKRINPISERQKERLKEYAKVKREWWKEVGDKYCVVMFEVFSKVVPVDNHPHHWAGKLGELLCDDRLFMAVSFAGHRFIHDNVEEARKRNYLCPIGAWNDHKKALDCASRLGIPSMNDPVRDYLREIGRKGGKSGTGKSKARSSSQARDSARARWKNTGNNKKKPKTGD